jgi:hypothetical protein
MSSDRKWLKISERHANLIGFMFRDPVRKTADGHEVFATPDMITEIDNYFSKIDGIANV